MAPPRGQGPQALPDTERPAGPQLSEAGARRADAPAHPHTAAGSVPEAGRSSTALLSQVRRDKLSRRGHCHKVTGDSSGRRADPGHGQSREALLARGGLGCDEMSFRLD